MNKLVCKICGSEHKSLQRGFTQHITMKHKISVLEYYIKYEGFEIPKCSCGKDCKLRGGITFRATCRDKECANAYDRVVRKTAMNNPEVKEKLRNKRLDWMKANPEKTAWRLGNKQSWPEKFFEESCKRIGLDKQYQIVRELCIYPFFVDFAFPQIKVAVEIDGSQHETNAFRKAKDEEKDNLLKNKGWKVHRIPARMFYGNDNVDLAMNLLLEFLGENKVFDEVGFISTKDIK